MIDFSGKRVVIFGGGDVGARKATYFCGQSDVTIISRSFSPAFDSLPVTKKLADISGMGDEDLKSTIQGAFLVIAATSDTILNDRVGRACSRERILFNNAVGIHGDVYIPSKVEGRHYLIAISTGGESPGVSRYLREHIGSTLPGLDDMIELQGRLRENLKQKEPDQSRRRHVLRDVICDQDVWNALSSGQGAAWEIVERRYLNG